MKNDLIKNQRGAAVLLVSVVMLIAVTMVVMFAARVGILDQRISGNELRHKVAFASAEAGLDQAAAYLRANPVLHNGNVADGWATCTGSAAIFPCDLADAQMVFATVAVGASITSSVSNIAALPLSTSFLVKTTTNTTAIGQGTSDDGTGAAIAQVSFAKTSLLTPGEIPPLMIPSGDLSGNFNIVPNPNGGGPGVPISVWAKDTTDTSNANWKTCDHGDFKDNGVCMDTKGDGSWRGCSCTAERSNSTNVNTDIVLYPEVDFPTSSFVYLFGDAAAGDTLLTLKPEIQALAEATGLVLDNCDSLELEFNGLSGSALVWVTGDCTVGAGVMIGSRSKPIILVTEGDLTISANGEVWGVMVGLGQFTLNGGAMVHGSAVSEVNAFHTNGTYYQVYDESVFENLRDDTINTEIAKVSYSWRDFTP